MNKWLVVFLGGAVALLLSACSPIKSPIHLETWTHGRIQLATTATVLDTENVVFSVDGQELHGAEIAGYRWVEFKRVNEESPASFVVVTDSGFFGTNPSHIQLSKKTDGQDTCPNWSLKFFGSYCESEAFSVP